MADYSKFFEQSRKLPRRVHPSPEEELPESVHLDEEARYKQEKMRQNEEFDTTLPANRLGTKPKASSYGSYGNRKRDPGKKVRVEGGDPFQDFADMGETEPALVPQNPVDKERIAKMREHLFQTMRHYPTLSGKPLTREDIPDILPDVRYTGHAVPGEDRNRMFLRSFDPEDPADRSAAYHETAHMLTGRGDETRDENYLEKFNDSSLVPFYLQNDYIQKKKMKQGDFEMGPHDTTAILLGKQLDNEHADRERGIGQTLYETFIHPRIPKPSEHYNPTLRRAIMRPEAENKRDAIRWKRKEEERELQKGDRNGKQAANVR